MARECQHCLTLSIALLFLAVVWNCIKLRWLVWCWCYTISSSKYYLFFSIFALNYCSLLAVSFLSFCAVCLAENTFPQLFSLFFTFLLFWRFPNVSQRITSFIRFFSLIYFGFFFFLCAVRTLASKCKLLWPHFVLSRVWWAESMPFFCVLLKNE